MKKIKVIVTGTLEVPDDWSVVEHADGFSVIKINDVYCDFNFMCLTTKSSDPGITWEEDDQVTELVMEHLESMSSEIDDISNV